MITVRNLRKRFGNRVALGDVSFSAGDGSILGLLGPNGSGKTTTVRIIGGLLKSDAGTVDVDGLDPREKLADVRHRLGVLTDHLGNYPHLTSREHIEYFGRLRGMDWAALQRRIRDLFESLRMADLADRRVGGFSQGERMKVALARALVHDPPNVILDEPATGLDVSSVRALRTMLLNLRREGKCVLVSSHIMQEVSAVCDRVVVLSGGTVVADEAPDELIQRTGAASLEEAFVAVIQSEGENAA